jgi:hypothetical protein
LDAVPPQQQGYIKNLFGTAQSAIDFGVVASTTNERLRFWKAWVHFLAIYFPTYDEKLNTLSQQDRIDVLVCFAQHVRSGGVSKRKQHVRAQTVQVSLRAITSRFELDGEQSPVVTPQGKYHKKISQLIEGYKRHDPPPNFQLAVPLTVPAFMHTFSRSGTEKQKAVGDMALIAFYYLLRVGEYTSSGTTNTKLTQAFRLRDVTLWDNNTILPHSLQLNTLLLRCTAATLRISNQKNGKRNQAIHHEAQDCDTCPAKALIRRIKHICSHTSDTNTIISTFFESEFHNGKLMRGSDINGAIKAAVDRLDLKKHGFQVSQINSHSLRAGGAMALHLNNIPTHTIRKMGRWSSDTFLDYIHEQIAVFSAGLSTAMGKSILFHNIGFQGITAPVLDNADI